jgi:hypothetical protein
MMPVIQLTVPGPFLSEDSLSRLFAKRSSDMTKFLFVATILSLSIMNAKLASAQAAVGEPGMYQFYHPDGDVLHVGPGYSGYYGSRAESREGMAPVAVARPARGHRHGRTQ